MVAEYMTSIKAAWELAKGVKVATDAIEDANIKLQMAELISALADAKVEAAENVEKLAELEGKLRAKEELMFENGAYYRIQNDNKIGPFCATCFDKDGKVIRLQRVNNAFGTHSCFVCQCTY